MEYNYGTLPPRSSKFGKRGTKKNVIKREFNSEGNSVLNIDIFDKTTELNTEVSIPSRRKKTTSKPKYIKANKKTRFEESILKIIFSIFKEDAFRFSSKSKSEKNEIQEIKAKKRAYKRMKRKEFIFQKMLICFMFILVSSIIGFALFGK